MAKTRSLSVGFLFDDTLDSSDGVAQQVKLIGSWLSSRGHKVSYLVGETKMNEWAGGKVYSLARNQKVVFNGNRLTMPLPASRNKIKDLLKNHPFDVLHVQVPYSPFMAKHVINEASPNTAIVGTFHVYPAKAWISLGTRMLRLLLGKSLKRFDEMIAVSKPAADFAKSTFRVNCKIIPNCTNVTKGTRIKSDNSEIIVFLGRLVKRKGTVELLEAFSLLHQKMPNVKLVIGGDGPMRTKIENFISVNNLGNCVNLVGFVPEDKKNQFLANADIACFPSLYGESFGIVLIEAMAAGAGVVLGGDNPGYRSVLAEAPQLLVDSKNSTAFSQRLYTLLTDKKLASKFHEWQQDQVQKYDVNTVGRQIEDLYLASIDKRVKAGHN